VYFKQSVLEKFGIRDTERKYTGDMEFWFRLASHGKLVHLKETLATHRTHPNSKSVDEKSSKMAEELLSIEKTLLASGILPKEIRGKQNQILSRAYYVSTFYSRNEPVQKFKYALLSLLSAPWMVLNNTLKSIFHKVLNIIFKSLLVCGSFCINFSPH